MMPLSRTGRVPIVLTIVSMFVGMVVLLLGSLLTINYISSLRNTLPLMIEIAAQASNFVTDELRDHLLAQR